MSRYVRKTDRGIIDFNALVAAIKKIKLDNTSIRSAAIFYKIPRSSLTRYIKKLNDEIEDISTIDDDTLLKLVKIIASYASLLKVFSSEQEEILIAYIKKCCDHYYGLSISDLRLLAYQFAQKMGANYPPSWEKNKTAGRDWYYSFMQRHSYLTLRTPEQTSLNRVNAFCRDNVDLFFKKLDNVLAIHSFRLSNIWNMDETGFSTVPSKIAKAISIRGAKKVGLISSAERRSMITMALAVNAEGNSIPTFFLVPTKKMQGHYMDDASPGAVATANVSELMCQLNFLKYMRHFIQQTNSSLDNPTLLLIDSYSSHLSIEALDMALENGVILLSFPPHCSYKLQPLDVSVYGPVKAYYKSQCNAWLKSNANKVIEIRHIFSLVRKTLNLALTPRNIKAGFQATGISPFNPDIFVDSDFVQAVRVDGENQAVLAAEPEEVNDELQLRIIYIPEVVAHEKASTSATSLLPDESSLSSILSSIGPLQASTLVKKSNRGRKPMKSCILSSPENISELKEKQNKRMAAKKTASGSKEKKELKRKLAGKQPAPKRAKKKSTCSSSPSDDDTGDDKDFKLCIICMRPMPRKLSGLNSIECNMCKRVVHLKCANMRYSFFTCSNCESD